MAEQAAAPRAERSEKRVRAYLGGQLVAETRNALLVWDKPAPPAYYFPKPDVKADLIAASDAKVLSELQGEGECFDVVVGEHVASGAARAYPGSPDAQLRERVAFDWNAMDSWFEEDEEVFFSPRDPRHRVEILPSSRHIEVVIDGVKVADSLHSRVLFESGLPPRFYMPLVDVRMDLLSPSSTTSRCPYKGVASYWNTTCNGRTFEDLVWSYKTPLSESLPIAGLACFWNEKLDLYVDGVLDERSSATRSSR